MKVELRAISLLDIIDGTLVAIDRSWRIVPFSVPCIVFQTKITKRYILSFNENIMSLSGCIFLFCTELDIYQSHLEGPLRLAQGRNM